MQQAVKLVRTHLNVGLFNFCFCLCIHFALGIVAQPNYWDRGRLARLKLQFHSRLVESHNRLKVAFNAAGGTAAWSQ
jgi:hypothetical protein